MATSFSPRHTSGFQPVLLSRDDLHKSVFLQPVREYSNPGKIYLYQNNIYIVDTFKGIHVIDNSDPKTPTKIGFIHIPGCMDLSIRNNVLFADNAVDLVSIDLSNYPAITILNRINDVFPEPTPPGETTIPNEFTSRNRPANTIITGWE
jgi:hypothetical protein